MSKKPIIIISLVTFIFIMFALMLSNQSKKVQTPRIIIPTNTNTMNESTPTPITPVATNFTASFEIFTNGTKRIFTSSMYHNQSESVYIQNPDPSVIFVSQTGITWDDFFKTLPFSLDKECLVTGTKQTFCSNQTQKLRFYINEIEQPNALDIEIMPNDELRVVYN